MARQTLGRGLSALLGDEQPTPAGEAPSYEIDIDLIEPNPEQPRTRFAEANLEELTKSIRANGVIQPIVVRKFGTRYQIVAGERRWRASQRAELRRIPAIVKEVSDEKLLEIALIENIQRHELNPLEEARAYRKLIDTIGLTQEQVADRIGKERSSVAASMRLLRLPEEIQRLIEEGGLTSAHGRALLGTDDAKIQKVAAMAAIEHNWSVRETEKALRRIKKGDLPDDNSAKPERVVDPNVKAAETKLMRTLNTNVKIHEGRKGIGGKIEIEYYSLDDLDRIFSVILKK
ncbi:MAG TPA: ParB/RepB/Spo0J family partition protein [Pyrinomonadaceae bacterium]|nr:ParB/RepB/Spo0J family partition protein [Acidobacteriota bacterium]HQZ94728.1 ParB/RepB/Spo0J family partition protein [Pyrinomonadaceae bacterium]